ncbi:hypothetical protein AVEN_127058-1 [Araneus ventricosus]|uniref:Uncharacterized protein n=1 Tax=Araneus ventricosus TaxID=182803 RepID=A0A4Y2I1T7_ARAVE|nr:hypothetical protein AVEN_127058-1 [Araneus ventricosus]
MFMEHISKFVIFCSIQHKTSPDSQREYQDICNETRNRRPWKCERSTKQAGVPPPPSDLHMSHHIRH